VVSLWLAMVGMADAQEYRPPGDVVPDAVVAHITPEGFDAVEDVIAALIPTLLGESTLALDDIDLGGILTLENLKPIIEVRSVQITPRDGVLDVRARIKIDLNSPSDPMTIGGICDETGWIGPLDADLLVNLSIDVVVDQQGNRAFDVTLDTSLGLDVDPPGLFSEGDFHLGVCGGLLGTLLGVFESAIVGIIQGPIDDALGGLETTLEDALSGAALSQDLDLLDTTLSLAIEPRQVNITTEGMEILLNMASDAPPADCVALFDPGGSLKTGAPKPTLASNPTGTQVAAHVADDALNQLLYAAWRGGVLCYTIDADSGLDLPITLDTSLLTVIAGEGYRSIIGPVAKPLIIKTLPKQVPTLIFDGTHDIEAEINELGLGFFGEVDDRIARLLNVEVDVNAGVDLPFDPATGALAVAVDLGADDLTFRVMPDSLVAGTEAATQEAIAGLVGGLVPQLVGPLLENLAFAIPSFSGIGLTSLDIYSADGEWLTASVGIGPAPEGAPDGCETTTDPVTGEPVSGCACDSSSCDSGCSTASVRFSPAAIGLAAMWLMRRRRR
jgi:hypothetical protein